MAGGGGSSGGRLRPSEKSGYPCAAPSMDDEAIVI